MDDDSNDLAQRNVDNLRIAGYVAPRLRDASDEVRGRAVFVVSKEGTVTRKVSLETLQKSLLAARKVEFDVFGRPVEKYCKNCSEPLPVAKCGREPVYCDPCLKERQRKSQSQTCVDCRKALGKNAKANGNLRCRMCAPAYLSQATSWERELIRRKKVKFGEWVVSVVDHPKLGPDALWLIDFVDSVFAIDGLSYKVIKRAIDRASIWADVADHKKSGYCECEACAYLYCLHDNYQCFLRGEEYEVDE